MFDTDLLDNLTGPKHTAAIALLDGKTIIEAAKLAGVTRSTVWRWMQDAQYAALIRGVQAHHMSATAQALAAAGVGAVSTLVELSENPTMPPQVRVRAASELLARMTPTLQTLHMEEQMVTKLINIVHEVINTPVDDE